MTSLVARASWWSAVAVYRQPRVLSMSFLGFSAGLPFMLVFQTLSAWLRQAGIERATIGMLAWVGLVYSLKFLWAPVVDRLRLPLLHRLLGRRRSWILLAQIGVGIGLLNIAGSDPAVSVVHVAMCALAVAFAAATQDIAVDAWRIESAPIDMQGVMAAAYQLGYRIAIMVGSAGTLWLAADRGWHFAYAAMAALMATGIVTTLLVSEPLPRMKVPAVAMQDRPQAPTDTAGSPPRRSFHGAGGEEFRPRFQEKLAADEVDWLAELGTAEPRVAAWLQRHSDWPRLPRAAGAWILGAVICPVLDFFGRYGWGLGLLIFAFIGSYRLTDYAMGVMTNPFYLDHGYTLKEVAAVVKGFGLMASIVGVLVGGVVVARLGMIRALVLGSVMIMLSNLGFAVLAGTSHDTVHPSIIGLALVNSFDNLALGVHGTALVAFLSSLTSANYTATQYAVLSSLYAMPGKLLMGTSGFVVDALGYPAFFTYTASLSIPGLMLLYFLIRKFPAVARLDATTAK